MRFAASPPLRGPGLGWSSATHSTPAQGPTSREMSSPGVYVLTYHPPPGASANKYPRAAQAAENTGNTSPLPLQTYAQHLQPLLAVPDHHVVQERGTPLRNTGREPPALLSAELSRHVALLPSCRLCAGARARLVRCPTPYRLHYLYDGEII